MPQVTLPGLPPVTVHLRRSARARRLSLRVSQLDGRVTLTMPDYADESEALAFAETKADWVRKHLARRPEDETVGIGTVLPVEGQLRRVVEHKARGVELTADEIRVSARSGARRIRAFLIELARDRLTAASDRYAAQLGRGYNSLALRDTRSRWGSCSDGGRLMYSWRLVMAPVEVLEYVAAHEVAHLKEMNHSAAFWSEVERLYGPYDVERRWLRENAGALHRFRF
ncbi:MAG: M48 family metallopeptidase [Paracoccaceae bacterium]